MILAEMNTEVVRFVLLMLAVLIIGAVVIPRLGGWIFNPKDQSFLYVLLAIIGVVVVWLREPLLEFKNEHTGLFALFTILFVVFIVLVFLAKDKGKKKGKS